MVMVYQYEISQHETVCTKNDVSRPVAILIYIYTIKKIEIKILQGHCSNLDEFDYNIDEEFDYEEKL